MSPSPRRFLPPLLTLLLLPSIAAALGAQCVDHPVYRPGLRGVLLRFWVFAPLRANSTRFLRSAYLPRHTNHIYHFPWSAARSLRGLDLFFRQFDNEISDHFLTLHLQRPAKVFLLIPSWASIRFPLRLPGWTATGWVRLEKPVRTRFDFGVHASRTFHLPERAYLFQKAAKKAVRLPSRSLVEKHLRSLETSGKYVVLLAERDGRASAPPKGPGGDIILPGKQCPAWLHGAWTTPADDSEDDDVRGKKWRTWHPLWDPCYWCSYDHEHGSSAKDLMGYMPKFGYTAWKNGRQNEAHAGFKGYVFRAGPNFVYLNIHSHVSSQTRYSSQLHTVVLAVSRAKTKELLAELSVKADFGAFSARRKGGGDFPLLDSTDTLNTTDTQCRPRVGRTVNVVNPDNLDQRLKYRDGEHILTGDYESWKTSLPCTSSVPFHELTLDIKDPSTAMRDVRSVEQTKLGHYAFGEFQRHASLRRAISVRDMWVGDRECKFALNDISGLPKEGVFYTDRLGRLLLPGPGRTAIRQFLKPGFTAIISGEFEPVDAWTGLYKHGHTGAFRNIGYAVDPTEN